MTISTGTNLGSNEILAAIGAGVWEKCIRRTTPSSDAT